MGGNVHPLKQIETVRVESLHAGIELEGVATMLARLFHQPIEQRAPKSPRAIAVTRDQIIDIKKFSGKERFQESITGHSADFAIRLQKSEQVTIALLTQHLLNEFIGNFEMRPELAHDRETAANILARLRDSDPVIFFPSWGFS